MLAVFRVTIAALLLMTAAVSPIHAQGIGTPEYEIKYGLEYLQAGKYDMAALYFRQAVGLGPDHALAHFLLGGAYQGMGDAQRAGAALDRALALDPGLRSRMGELPPPPLEPEKVSPPAHAAQPRPSASSASIEAPVAMSCDDLFGACYVTATRCGLDGCRTDFLRQQQCFIERNACYQRNGQ